MNKRILVVILLCLCGVGLLFGDEPKPPEKTPPDKPPAPPASETPKPDPKETKPEPPKQNPPPVQPEIPRPVLTTKIGEVDKDKVTIVFYRMPPEEGKAVVPLLDKYKSTSGQIQYIDNLNLLVITDVKENIPTLEKILQIVSIPQPQVMIETLVIERVIKSDLQLGWEDTWTIPATTDTFFRKATETFHPGAYLQSLAAGAVGGFQGSTLEFNRTGYHGTLNVKLRLMVEQGDARILSSPRIMVASGRKASISSGQEVPYQQVTYPGGGASTATTVYKQALISLTVTPTIVEGNVIRMTITPSVTTLSGYIVIAGSETPYFATRSADTNVSLRNGEKITIGGLVREEDVTSERGIPFISDIPILGYLFKRYQKDKNKTEIIFVIKPYLVTTPEEAGHPCLLEEHK